MFLQIKMHISTDSSLNGAYFLSFKEIYIFRNGGHLGSRARLPYTILKVDKPKIISVQFDFGCEDFNKIYYENKRDLHNQYKLAKQKFALSLPCSSCCCLNFVFILT